MLSLYRHLVSVNYLRRVLRFVAGVPPRAILSLLWLVSASRSVADSVDAAGIAQLRIDRWSAAGEQIEADEATIQQVAQHAGCGHFYVRSAPVERGGVPAETTRVFFIYPSMEALQARSPGRRIICRTNSNRVEVKTGSSEEIITDLLSNVSGAGNIPDQVVSRMMPEVLAAVLFQGRGQVWKVGTHDLSDSELALLDACPVTKREEMRALVCAPPASSAEGTWLGRFVKDDGGMEEVTVIFSRGQNPPLILKRAALRPAGYFSVSAPTPLPSEEWTVAKDSSWKAPQRYKMMVMLAALGNVEKQFQLGAALLQESDVAAKAEGIKWLEIAAARGNRDAAELLHESPELLVRSDRDRDKVRVARCCPVPGR